MIRHSVYFAFAPGATAADREQHIADFGSLPERISEIRRYEYGLGVSDPDSGSGPRYDVAHYLDFADAESLKRYIRHDAHQEFIARNKGSWDSVMVVDSEIQ